MTPRYVLIIQCDIAHNRCSGYACTDSFYQRKSVFSAYAPDTPYLSFTCGGCCGKGVAAKLEHFSEKLRKNTDIAKDEVAVHLASCMVTDNHHYNRCPHAGYIHQIIRKHGYNQVIEGSYISRASETLRKNGIYQSY